MKSAVLKKHHFWLLFGAVPLLVGLLVIMLMTIPGEAIGEQAGNYKKRADEVGGAKAMGVGMLTELDKQKGTLEERRGQLWGINYDRQRREGIFAWPDASRDRYLKDLEKLDLRFGAMEVDNLDSTKDADTQFIVRNDEKSKFVDPANYNESYNKLAATIAPTRFAGTGWQSVLRYVSDWTKTPRPASNLLWLALEDFWIQRALLRPIAEVNANAAKFDLVKPAAGTADTPLKRKFQNRTWEIDIELATEGPNRVLKSKLKNKTDRLQMLGANKSMRLKVWLDDPALSNSQPFEYKIGGELVKGLGELAPRVVPEIHKIPAGSDPAAIYKIEQILDEITVPIRLVRRVELGYRDSKRQAADLKQPAFFPEEAAPTETSTSMMAPPAGGGTMKPGESPEGMMGGMGPMSGGAGGTTARVGTPEQVLLGNKKRYLERTEQVRRMPVGLDLVVDQAYVNDVLIALGNSPLRIQITQSQWQRFRDPLTAGGAGGAAPSGGNVEGDPDNRGPGAMMPPMAPGGISGGPSSALPSSQVTAGLVELAVYGIVSIYEKAKSKPVDPNKPADPKTTELPTPAPMNPTPKPEVPMNPGVPPTPAPK